LTWIRSSNFHFFGFRDNNFFTEQSRQLCVQPPNLEDQVSESMFLSDRETQLYPQTPDSLFVVFYDSQGYDVGVLNRHHTESITIALTISTSGEYINR
jgi:hypothetical protein